MISKDAILFSRDILTIDNVYNALCLKKKMKHHLVIGFKAQTKGLIDNQEILVMPILQKKAIAMEVFW